MGKQKNGRLAPIGFLLGAGSSSHVLPLSSLPTILYHHNCHHLHFADGANEVQENNTIPKVTVLSDREGTRTQTLSWSPTQVHPTQDVHSEVLLKFLTVFKGKLLQGGQG